MARFETALLASRGNLRGSEALNRAWVERAATVTATRAVILDLGSSESPIYGEQEGSAYNGHFAKLCYHPLFCFNHLGDLEGAMLREGKVAFAMPAVYEYLEDNAVLYAIRIKANAVLERNIEPLLRRRDGRASRKPEVHYASFT